MGLRRNFILQGFMKDAWSFSVLFGIEVIIVDTLLEDRCTSLRSFPQRNAFGVNVAEKS
jgi:hypothetical protein